MSGKHRSLSLKCAMALVVISDSDDGADVRYIARQSGLDYTEARTAIYALTQKGLVERLKRARGTRGRPVNVLFSTELGDRHAIALERDIDALLSRGE